MIAFHDFLIGSRESDEELPEINAWAKKSDVEILCIETLRPPGAAGGKGQGYRVWYKIEAETVRREAKAWRSKRNDNNRHRGVDHVVAVSIVIFLMLAIANGIFVFFYGIANVAAVLEHDMTFVGAVYKTFVNWEFLLLVVALGSLNLFRKRYPR